jgi:hypothetical protein
MNVEVGAQAALFPEKEYISGIFVAVWGPAWGAGGRSGWYPCLLESTCRSVCAACSLCTALKNKCRRLFQPERKRNLKFHPIYECDGGTAEAEFLDVFGTKVLRFFLLPPPPPPATVFETGL